MGFLIGEMDSNNAFVVFEDRKIRRTWHDEE